MSYTIQTETTGYSVWALSEYTGSKTDCIGHTSTRQEAEKLISDLSRIAIAIKVLPTIAWVCEDCGATDTLELWAHWETWGLMARIALEHAILAPECKSVNQIPKEIDPDV